MAERSPADQGARDRIVDDLDATLFVEAGAGSGKTSALVARVVATVTAGAAELRAIAAITFTEKAGAELRDRLRRALHERATRSTDPVVADRCHVALDQLDSAAIGTLHSFARRVLAEHPIEAGLPPRIDVLDEVSSRVEFDRRWSAFREKLFHDADLERSLLLLLACGVKPPALDALARAFEADWDLVADRVPVTAPEPAGVSTLVGEAYDAFAAAFAARDECRDPNDLLCERLDQLADYVARLRRIDDELDLLEALGEDASTRPSFRVGNCGRAANWRDVRAVRGHVDAAGKAFDRVRDTIANACAHRIGAAIRAFTLAAADERRAAGQLEFHDLLVLARSLLRDPANGPAVRARLHARYQRLLLDEFQDTDPIQIELAVRIAAADPSSPAAGAVGWDDVTVAPGHLFVVGDPKQSIYRFRRADIATFLCARDRFGHDSGGTVELTTNFRSADAVIGWINQVFGTLIGKEAAGTAVLASQPDYIALVADRPTPPAGPAVSVIGRVTHDADAGADHMRAAEAAEVAATVATVIAEGWSVDDRAGGWRPARLADVTVLIPARTSLPFLQDALDAGGIPYRADSSSLVYATRAVRDLLMVLRAVGDPTNELHTLAALRTPLLACGDDDLFRFRVERHGRWNFVAEQPDTVPPDDPVRAALDYLRATHEQRHWRAPSELLDRIARDRRAFELGFAEGRPRDVWRRLRFVIDQARAWSEATHGNLRQYLHWVDLQSAEGARVSESVLPETDDDAVGIMTIHAAKGLEFPVTIVSGMSTVPSRQAASAEVVFPPEGGVGYHFGKAVRTDEYLAWKPLDEQMDYDERKRLLYVACTRARDHLVVSICRRARKSVPEPPKRTNAELLVDGMGSSLDEVADAVGDGVAAVVPPAAARPGALAPLAEWRAERDEILARGARPAAIAATALTDEGTPDPASELGAGLQKRPRDLDLPPWLKGRYGTAIGRAVHGTLQTIDLATGAGIDAALAAQCEAEAIPDRAAQVRRLVEAALRAPSVREAATHPHWREVYACVSIEGRLLEGYVDLLYRGPHGLVVVDHKTAATDDPAELDRRVHAYRLQGASYALTIAAATAEPVRRVTFLFLTPSGPIERDLAALDDVMAEVVALVRTGAEITVDEPVTAS